jgi:hypothetical protein
MPAVTRMSSSSGHSGAATSTSTKLLQPTRHKPSVHDSRSSSITSCHIVRDLTCVLYPN